MPQKNQKTKKLFSNSIQLEAHQAEVNSGKFSHSGEYFATAGNDKAIHIWETFDKKCKNVNSILHAHSSPILEICWSNDDDRIASCSVDKRVTLWDIYNGKFIIKYKDHDNYIYSVDYYDNLICSVGEDCSLIINDIRSKDKTNSYNHKYQLTTCKFLKNDYIYFGGIDNQIYRYDLKKGEIDKNFALIGHNDTITGIDISHNFKYLLSNSMDNSLIIWDIQKKGGMLSKKLMGNKHGPDKNLLRCKWNYNDNLVSCGSSDKIVHIWDVKAGYIINNIYGHNGGVNEVDFNSIDTTIISSVSNDNTAIIGYYE